MQAATAGEAYEGLAVLLLDDDDENRGLSAEMFALENARVVQAATVKDAERELISNPGIDVVSLDVSLRGGGRDKQGAALAVRIREARPDLPIVGYSGYISESDLSADELGAFTDYFERGGSTGDIKQYVDRCLDEGLRYRRWRREAFRAQLAELSSQGQLQEREYSILMSFSPAPGEELSVERALTEAGYHIEVILPTPPNFSAYIPRRPVVVWVRQVDDGEEYEAEMFGQPTLYGVASTAAGAMRNLLEVFWLFAAELDEADATKLDGPALSLAHFFEHVLTR